MSGGGSDVLSDLSQLYVTYQEDIKSLYLKNQRLTYASSDTRTETNLLEVLERTDNVCSAVDAGNQSKARRELDHLEKAMQKTLCEAALFRPERQLEELRRRRFEHGF